MKTSIFFILIAVIFAVLPNVAFAGTPTAFSGIVTRLAGSQVYFKTTSAATYAAEVGSIPLQKKYGASMQFSEIFVGDKVEVRGKLWNDNSISATYFRDVSLYTHTTTISGKIENVNPLAATLTVSDANGNHVGHVDSSTTFKLNGSATTLNQLPVGARASIKGSWERANTEMMAQDVQVTVRLVGIELTGNVVMKNGTAITILSNGVLYAIDTSNAKIVNKAGKALSPIQLNLNDTLRISGKHINGQTQVTATQVRDLH